MTHHKGKNLFGTDGIRGTMGTTPFTGDGLARLGQAMAAFFTSYAAQHKAANKTVLFAHDGRHSAPFILQCLLPPLQKAKFHVINYGLLPTPGLSFMTHTENALGGIMISASHNPADDNGLKFFGVGGNKLSTQNAQAIETLYHTHNISVEQYASVGTHANPCEHTPKAYLDHLATTAKKIHVPELTIVCDTAHGAASQLAQHILPLTGAVCHFIACNPSGYNINEHCGSTAPRQLCKTVQEKKAHLGIAFDGDADRIILCDAKGTLFDGDQLLAFFAIHCTGKKEGATVASTVLANGALQDYLHTKNIKLVRTAVGDSALQEALKEKHTTIASEPSGHLIFQGDKTGDGLLNALRFLYYFQKSDQKKLTHFFEPHHQMAENIPLKRIPKNVLDNLQKVEEKISNMFPEARIVLRTSGTEPVLRLFVESKNSDTCHQVLHICGKHILN